MPAASGIALGFDAWSAGDRRPPDRRRDLGAGALTRDPRRVAGPAASRGRETSRGAGWAFPWAPSGPRDPGPPGTKDRTPRAWRWSSSSGPAGAQGRSARASGDGWLVGHGGAFVLTGGNGGPGARNAAPDARSRPDRAALPADVHGQGTPLEEGGTGRTLTGHGGSGPFRRSACPRHVTPRQRRPRYSAITGLSTMCSLQPAILEPVTTWRPKPTLPAAARPRITPRARSTTLGGVAQPPEPAVRTSCNSLTFVRHPDS
jgi:hypothetical protein